jgi:hypothetical protein
VGYKGKGTEVIGASVPSPIYDYVMRRGANVSQSGAWIARRIIAKWILDNAPLVAAVEEGMKQQVELTPDVIDAALTCFDAHERNTAVCKPHTDVATTAKNALAERSETRPPKRK